MMPRVRLGCCRPAAQSRVRRFRTGAIPVCPICGARRSRA